MSGAILKYVWLTAAAGLLVMGAGAAGGENDAEWEKRAGVAVGVQRARSSVNPKDVPGLTLWLDAAKGAAADADRRIAGWADQSGKGNDLAQPNAAKAPSVSPNAINGFPVVTFEGEEKAGRFIKRDSFALPGGAATLVVVCRHTAEKSWESMLSYGNWSMEMKGLRSLARPKAGEGWEKRAEVYASTGGILGKGFVILSATIDGGKPQMELFVNGAKAGSGGKPFSIPASGQLVVGSPQACFNGEIAELLLFDRVVAPAELAGVEEYLKSKYGLAGVSRVNPLASMLPFAYYPGRRQLEAAFDLRAFLEKAKKDPPKEKVKEAEVAVYALKGDKALAKDKIPLDGQGRGQALFDIPDLPDGEYRVEFKVGGIVVPADKTFTRKKFEFEGCQYGKERKVYPPFTPVEVKGNQVSVVDRTYTMNAFGTFDKIMSRGRDVIATPIRLRAETAKGEVEWKPGKVVGKVEHPDLAVFEGSAVSVLGTLASRTSVEEDGCAKVEWTLEPAKDAPEITRLWLEVVWADTQAAQFHYVGNDSMRHNYAGNTPRGGKIVWELDQGWVPCAWHAEPGPEDGEIWNAFDIRHWTKGSKDNFCPYVWLGAEDRGLCWFAGDLREGALSPERPTQTLAREKGNVVLRVDLVNVPLLLDAPRRFEFGLQASPAKPMPPDWRRRPVNGGGGCCVVCWGGYYCNDKYPDNRDFSIVDKILEERKTGKVDEAWWKEKDAARVFKPLKVLESEEWLKAMNWFRPPWIKVAYIEEHVFHPRTEEYAVFRDEWSCDDFERYAHFNWPPQGDAFWLDKPTKEQPSTVWSTGNAKPVAPSVVDFCVFYANEWLRRGINVYFDNMMPYQLRAAHLSDGHAGPRSMIWEQRAYYKRVWKRAQELYASGVVAEPVEFIGHVTNTQTIPMNAWLTATLDLEQPYRSDPKRKNQFKGQEGWMSDGDAYRLPFPPDYTRTMTLSRVVGAIPHAMFPLRNTGDYRGKIDKWPDHVCLSDWGMYRVHEIRGGGQGGTGRLVQMYHTVWQAYGYGAPDVEVLNYWADEPAIRCANDAVKWIMLRRKGAPHALLLLQSYGEKSETAPLAFPKTAALLDIESRETLSTDASGALAVAMPEDYGTRMFYVADAAAELPPALKPGPDVMFAADFDTGLRPDMTYSEMWVWNQKDTPVRIAPDSKNPRNLLLQLFPAHPARQNVPLSLPDDVQKDGRYELSLKFRIPETPKETGRQPLLGIHYHSPKGMEGCSFEVHLDAPKDGAASFLVTPIKAAVDGKGVEVRKGTADLTAAPATPADLEWHALRLRVDGTSSAVSIDGKLAADGGHEALTAGRLLLSSAGSHKGGLVPCVEIDDVTVKKLE